jgi:dTDP-glucose 4,6-dehydratase
MNILVTGGAGFIGSNFILYWLREHARDSVVNVDALTYAGNLENLKSIQNDTRYRFVHGDICDRDMLNKTLEGIDVVVHFAAESHVDRSILDPAKFMTTNVIGTYTLLEACREKKIPRFHHISTDEVFGALPLESSEKFNEHTPYDPRSPYSASKASSDHLVRAYIHTYGFPATISNCSNNYGPYQFPEKLFGLAITNIIEGKNVPVYGDGLYVRDWLYVEDHCRAIDMILQKGKIGDTYCIGGMDKDISNLDIIKKIIKVMGKDEKIIEFVKDRPGHDRRYSVDWSKIKNELGWNPLSDLDTYLKKTIMWYQENESWWRTVKSGEYQKYYTSQYGVSS